MNWIFPIAGKGTRVKKLAEFKPFLEINNQKMIYFFFEGIKHKIKKRINYILLQQRSTRIILKLVKI